MVTEWSKCWSQLEEDMQSVDGYSRRKMRNKWVIRYKNEDDPDGPNYWYWLGWAWGELFMDEMMVYSKRSAKHRLDQLQKRHEHDDMTLELFELSELD